ncbi:hypothetical protein PR003_g22997 [Phytophthora rubi]|uniref:Uncharacterized protein n=1 Tax=Phytophthora rubi TaxID=129364 RepID=A0A6A3K7L6_9STRA|nr:hypothetical protein PR002_g22099 [Phytophthora rubi]KAE9003031.1 hypothetical protein PR001_g18092 [Phytophthora rubi]KAE9299442.1 hypothetical protein PR003_g22997 [Phytophthora rubi]
MTCFGGVGEMSMRSARAAQGLSNKDLASSASSPPPRASPASCPPTTSFGIGLAARDDLLRQQVAVHHVVFSGYIYPESKAGLPCLANPV